MQQLIDLFQDPVDAQHHLNVDAFREYLHGHPTEQVDIMMIEEGYPLYAVERGKQRLCKRAKNIVNNKRELHAILKRMVKEAKQGYIYPASKQHLYCLNLLCVPKADKLTGLKTDIRVARHGSYCTRSTVSINDLIPKEHSTMDTLPNFTTYVRNLYNSEWVALRDLKDAFRQLLVRNEDRDFIYYSLFGMHWADRRVAYGVASAAACCQRFAMTLIWIIKHKLLPPELSRLTALTVHIDDFFIGTKTKAQCDKVAQAFDNLCDELGVQVSHEKDETSIQKGVVHGIKFDVQARPKLVDMPLVKYLDLRQGIQLMIVYERATGEALESVCGKIMHYSCYRKVSKVFCHRLIGFIHKHIRNNKRARTQVFDIPAEVLRDFGFYLQCFSSFKQSSMEDILFSPSITITGSTDASDVGGGFLIGGHWGSYLFREEPNQYGVSHRHMSINYQEAHAVIMLLDNFKHVLTGRKLWLFIDNTSVLYSLYRYWAGSVTLMDYCHEIALLLCKYHIQLRVDFIPTHMNVPADTLSRQKMDEFFAFVEEFNLMIDAEATPLTYYNELFLLNGA